LQLLKKLHTGKNRILIFVLYKKEVPQVAQFLQSNGYAVCAVHGDMPQPARTSVSLLSKI
jgi:ATP-dependent RNA helicase DBP3